MTDRRPDSPGHQESHERRDRPSMKGPLRTGLMVSAFLHVLFVLVYPFFAPPDVPGVIVAEPTTGDVQPVGMQVVQVVEIPDDQFVEPLPEQEETPELQVEEQIRAEPGVEVPAVEPGEPAPPRRRAVEVLAPQAEDSAIWRRVDPELAELTDIEEARLRLRWAASDWNAARDAEARAAEDALDWTHTDDEGNRWGVSPGKIHLGKVALPLPFGFGNARGTNPNAERARFQADEIDRAAARGAAWETQKARARAIREREDKKRKEAKGEKPDTTGVGR